MANADVVVLQDEKGDYYFLRPEILKETKVPKDLAHRVHASVEAAAEAQYEGRRHVKVVGSFKLQEVDEQEPDTKKYAAKGIWAQPKSAKRVALPVLDTVMCPW